jgi:hypothetical protein
MNEYEQMLHRWEDDTRFRLDRLAYAQLVEAGAAVVPMLLRAVERRSGWKALTALRGIFGEDGPVVEDIAGRFEPICQRWIDCARARGISW